jgi:hypothetical protein
VVSLARALRLRVVQRLRRPVDRIIEPSAGREGYAFAAGGFPAQEMHTMDSQRSRWSRAFPILIALGLSLASAGPVAASGSSALPVPICSSVTAPIWGSTLNWQGFYRYWRHFAGRADRVVVIVFAVLAAALFIITRGKWL